MTSQTQPQPSKSSRHGRLWNMWELFVLMKPFDAAGFMFLAGVTGTHKTIASVYDMIKERGFWGLYFSKERSQGGLGNQRIHSDQAETLKAAFVGVLPACEGVGLDASEDTVSRIIALLSRKDATWGEYHKLLSELDGRLLAQMQRRVFFSLTSEEARWYSRPQEGWEAIVDTFPSAISDIEEARKCFALGRYAASVFHSLQIVEVGVIALGKCLGCCDHQEGWSATTNAIQAITRKKHTDRTDFEKANFPFIEQMNGTVEALKNAWRNKVSHVQGKLVVMTADFSPDVAEDILSATRAFMRRIATESPSLPSEKRPS